MGYANYRWIERFSLPHKLPFRGNSMWGKWDTLMPTHPIYKVYSYNALIATWDEPRGWALHEPHRGSKTTTRHQNIMRRVTGLEYPDGQE